MALRQVLTPIEREGTGRAQEVYPHGLTERLPVDSPWRSFESQLQTEPPSLGVGEAPPRKAYCISSFLDPGSSP